MSGVFESEPSWPDVPRKTETEGLASFEVIDAKTIYDSPTFFNPAMGLNRDFSLIFMVLYAKKFSKKLRMLDPLAGIGIRAIRAGLEITDYLSEVVINDYSELTCQVSNYNIHKNGLTDLITIYQREARALMLDLSENNKKYHYVDIDPFGPLTPFIDDVWATLSLSGLVSITATDTTALCGVYPKACYRKYGGIPLNNHHTHETGARILISAIARSAARHEFGLVVFFTLTADHYFKIFIHAKKRRGYATDTVMDIGYSYTCPECFEIRYDAGSRPDSMECCGIISDVAGPLWCGNLFSKEWTKNARNLLFENSEDIQDHNIKLQNSKRVEKLITEGIEGWDLKGYYTSDTISKKLRLGQPSFAKVAERLEEQGYRFVRTWFTKNSFRSDAPGTLVVKIFKDLVGEDKS